MDPPPPPKKKRKKIDLRSFASLRPETRKPQAAARRQISGSWGEGNPRRGRDGCGGQRGEYGGDLDRQGRRPCETQRHGHGYRARRCKFLPDLSLLISSLPIAIGEGIEIPGLPSQSEGFSSPKSFSPLLSAELHPRVVFAISPSSIRNGNLPNVF